MIKYIIFGLFHFGNWDVFHLKSIRWTEEAPFLTLSDPIHDNYFLLLILI